MENINKVKIIINRLNRACDRLEASISSILESWEISQFDFLVMIGLNKELKDSLMAEIVGKLFKSNDTRINIDSNIDSIEHSEIEIYSKILGINIGILKNVVKISFTTTLEDEENIFYKEEYRALRLKNGNVEEIHFELNTRTAKTELQKRVITQKYKLAHISLNVIYKFNDSTINFGITINNDMLASDLNYLKRLLYNFNLEQVKNILDGYPALIKILSDEVNLNNFNNR